MLSRHHLCRCPRPRPKCSAYLEPPLGQLKTPPRSPSATLFSRSSTRNRPACVRDAAGGCAVFGGRRRAPSPSVVAAACAARSRSLILAPAIPAREREQFQGAIFRRLGEIDAVPDRCSDCETFSRRKLQVRDKREKGEKNKGNFFRYLFGFWVLPSLFLSLSFWFHSFPTPRPKKHWSRRERLARSSDASPALGEARLCLWWRQRRRRLCPRSGPCCCCCCSRQPSSPAASAAAELSSSDCRRVPRVRPSFPRLRRRAPSSRFRRRLLVLSCLGGRGRGRPSVAAEEKRGRS